MFSKIFDFFANFILKIILNKIIFGIITFFVFVGVTLGVQGTCLQIIKFLEIIIGINTSFGNLISELIIFFINLHSKDIICWVSILIFLILIFYLNKKSKEWKK